MKNKFIIKLEESIDNTKELTFEDAMRILKKKNVDKEFKKIFEGKEIISEEEINELSTSSVVKCLLYLYARLNNIEIKINNSISISDLDYSIYFYYKNATSIDVFSKEMEEELLASSSSSDKQLVIESRINYVFSETLRYATDAEIFKELLSEGNNALVDSVENYNPNKHGSFDIYLTYNLNNALSNKLDEIIGYRNQPIVDISYDFADEQKAFEDRELIKELLNESGLTDAEKAVLIIEYGLSDTYGLREEFFKEVSSYNIINTLSLQISAIEKIRQKKARK